MARRRAPRRVFRPNVRPGGARRRRRPAAARALQEEQRRPGPPVGGVVELPAPLRVQELAERLGLSGVEVIKQLMRDGVMANLTQLVDFPTAAMVAAELGFQPRELPQAPEPAVPERAEAPVEAAEGEAKETQRELPTRPPVVTILGHVDHGKTTLLDVIRQSKVAEGEAGGITQHIGAYQVETEGKRITFLDTPGHEAFTAMRARGAWVTDIAVLVVAADDGVMPQTVEAIDHARAAGVPIVVAINKTDRPDANVERVKLQLTERELVLEEWGGDVIAVPVSAKTGEGVPELLENLLVVAEVAELKADPERLAEGVVIEARVDRTRGPLATVLVRNGTLHQGEPIVAGEAWGRVKALLDEGGTRVRSAGPAEPVEVLGLDKLPQAGDLVRAFALDREARALVEQRERQRQREPAPSGAAVLRAPYLESGEGEAVEMRDLPLIVKTDVQGSVEPVRQSLERLSTERARVRLLHAAAGTINETDVLLAIASRAMIIGFNTQTEPGAQRLAQAEGVEVRTYQVIYALVDEVRQALEGVLEPVQREVVDGHGQLRAVFSRGRRIRIAGVYVTDGRVARTSRVRVLRGDDILCEGSITSLKRFKDDAREVTAGLECGLAIDGCNDFADGDAFLFFHTESSRP